jgi:hypothetical protein
LFTLLLGNFPKMDSTIKQKYSSWIPILEKCWQKASQRPTAAELIGMTAHI